MTIEQARGVLAVASSSQPKLLGDRSLRRRARAAVRFVRRSPHRTYCDMELVALVENMLAGKGTRWPEPHEITGAVLFDTDLDGVENMSGFIVALTKRGRKFQVKHEVARFVVKPGKSGRK